MKKIFLVLALILMIVTSACAVDGTYTTYGNFYLPPYGGYGIAEWTEYNTYMQIADTQIEANKVAVTTEGIQDIAGAMVSGNTETFLTLTYQDADGTIDGVVPVLDEDNMASDSATHLVTQQSAKAYIDANIGGANTFLELTDTPGAYDTGKYAKSTADGVVFDTPVGAGNMLMAVYDTDEDGDIEVSSGGTEKSSWTQYCIPYLTTATAFGEIPIGTDNYALTVNGATGYDWTRLQVYDAALTSVSGLTYVSPSFIKLTANDTYAVRTIAQTKTDLGLDLSLYYLKTAIDTQGEVETIWSVALATDAEVVTALTDYYLKTAIDTQGEVETIWGVTLATDTEVAALTFPDLDDTPAGYDNGKYAKSTAAGVVWDSPAVTDKLKWVFPQDYATGTGTSGDPWAGSCIEDAYTACPTGGTIFLRAGYYQLTGSLTIKKAINVIGEGINRTIVRTSEAAHGIYIWYEDYVTIRGMTIDGDAQIGGDLKNGILAEYCEYIILEDIEVKNTGRIGVCGATKNSYFHNIYSHDNYSHGMHQVGDPAGWNVNNIYRDIYSWDNGGGGFDMTGYESAFDETVNNNVYDNINAWGNTSDGIAFEYLNGCVLTNSYSIDNTNRGFYFNYCENFTVNTCYASQSGVDGLTVWNSDDMNFTNIISTSNNSTDASNFGIEVGSCNNTVITSSQFYDNRKVQGTDIAFVDGGEGADTITKVTAGFLTAGFVAGKDITVTGAAEAGNNDTFTIVSVIDGTITLATGVLTAEAATEDVTITNYLQHYGMKLNGGNAIISNCKFSPNVTGEIYYTGAGETISFGAVNDDLDLVFGNDRNWLVQYDEGVDDQLLWITAGTNAGADTDAMFEIITGASMDADQQVFAVSKGTQASKTQLFAVDEDGEVTVGIWVATAIADAYIPDTITIDDATLAATFTVTDNESEDLDCPILFVDGGTGAQGAEADGDLHYSPDTGALTARMHRVYLTGESTALNAGWWEIKTTATTGDHTGLRTVMRSDAASGDLNVRGVYGQGVVEAGKYAGILQGGLFTASNAGGTGNIDNVYVLGAHYSSGANTTVSGDFYLGFLKSQTRSTNARSVTGHDVLLGLENEAIEGTGMTMDSAIRIFGTNTGVDDFTYGIDMSDAEIATADILLQNSETISNTVDGIIDIDGEIDMNANSVGFTLQAVTGSDTTTTIDWGLGNKFKFTFGAMNETFTFTAPTNPCTLMLTIIQDGVGSRTITWPGTVKWAGGVAPTLTTTASARDKIALDWDGTQYDGVASLDFK